MRLGLLWAAGGPRGARPFSRWCGGRERCRLHFRARLGHSPPSLRLNSCISIDFYKLGRRPPHFAETSRVHLDFDEGVPPPPPPFRKECGSFLFHKVCCCGGGQEGGNALFFMGEISHKRALLLKRAKS